MVHDIISDFDDLSVDEAKTRLFEERDLTEQELLTVAEYEQENENRSTLLTPIEEELSALDEDDDAVTEDSVDSGFNPETEDLTDVDLVRVNPQRRYFAGRWLDSLDPITVEHTQRVKNAIDAGYAEILGHPDSVEETE